MTENVEDFAALLHEGETVTKLDTSGWIVMRHLLGDSDEIIIRADGISHLFDRPVRAVVRAVSSIGTLAIDLITKGAKDRSGNEWGLIDGWVDVLYDAYLVTRPTDTVWLPLIRGDGKTWMLQGPYTVEVERETEQYWFGYSTDAPFRCRVWSKAEWKING